MKVLAIIFLIGLFQSPVSLAQSAQKSLTLNIMAAALNQTSIDSVPLNVSLPKEVRSSEVTFPISEEKSGAIFIMGTPYDSVGVQIPADISVANQFGESAELKSFQLSYGKSDEVSSMDVVPPSGCRTVQIPKTGRIHIRLGGTLVSGEELRGTYTRSVRFDCSSQ